MAGERPPAAARMPAGRAATTRTEIRWPRFARFGWVSPPAESTTAARYAELVPDRALAASVFGRIEAEWRLSREAVLSITGFMEQPFSCPRWDTVSNDAYGRSPAMDALPDNKQLQVEQKRKAMAIDKMASYAVNQIGKQGDAASGTVDKAKGYIDLFKNLVNKK